ncbi:MAG: alpha-hydroxy-acid oxidizing protein [Chloroflexi bacterium]|nr:alpha-hydroxy-acid oxidizing protein [Chloroflexota bacterium]
MVATQSFLTLPELRRAAKRSLPPEVWDYVSGGAESETTLRRNRRALQHYQFRPRVLRDVHDIDLSTSFLGIPLRLPVMIAPMGSMYLVHPEGDVALARAAAQVGSVHWLSTMTHSAPEDVAAAAEGRVIFQLYFRGDNAWAEELIRRIEAAGFRALALTVDSAMYGRRERDLERRYDPRGVGNRVLNVPLDRGLRQTKLSWADVEWLKKTTHLPLILKGIQCAEDARLAAEHEVAAVYVSNHGGRQLDHAPASIEILAECVEAVAGRAEVIVDSGFQRGTDVLKALALGARAVCVGKLAAWGLGAAGAEGAARTLEILATELRVAMANCGVRRLTELTPALVRRVCDCR